MTAIIYSIAVSFCIECLRSAVLSLLVKVDNTGKSCYLEKKKNMQ